MPSAPPAPLTTGSRRDSVTATTSTTHLRECYDIAAGPTVAVGASATPTAAAAVGAAVGVPRVFARVRQHIAAGSAVAVDAGTREAPKRHQPVGA